MSAATVLTSYVTHARVAAQRPSGRATAPAHPVAALPPIDYDRYRAEAHRLRIEAIRSTMPALRAWLRRLRSR